MNTFEYLHRCKKILKKKLRSEGASFDLEDFAIISYAVLSSITRILENCAKMQDSILK
jgi:hypothetical protein